MKLKCHKCNHIWEYKGSKVEYCNCPRKKCGFRVNIKKCEIKKKVIKDSSIKTFYEAECAANQILDSINYMNKRNEPTDKYLFKKIVGLPK